MSDRFGFDAPKNIPIEKSIAWGAQNGFKFIDFNADNAPNDLASFDKPRASRIRSLLEDTGIQIGVHPVSAINNAEYVPIMSEAVDDYLQANLELADRIGAGWIVGHGGYHFGDTDKRQQAAVDRIKRLTDRAVKLGKMVYFENHNKEPEHSEMHYIPHNVEETRWFLDEIDAPHFKWAFNVAHGHLVPEGWAGFLDAFGTDNIGQVRVNDNSGDYEIHLVPGEGTIDFPALFKALEGGGYKGWYNLGFGDEADKIRIRDWFETLIEN
ncbi:MAG: endonuclease [Gemmatimonadetes bacterium]|nr:endonuclease [Gemmatimonadota bacterium]|tara:strand:+ start:127 stop:930 length:804 start_codon:yes stop_codon:yes gene_type:complete